MQDKYIRKTGVVLRRVRTVDVEGPYGRAMADPAVLQFTEARHQRQGPQDLRRWVRRHNDDPAVVLRGVWDGKAHVGNIKAVVDRWHGVAEVGLIIWVPRRGYGRAALDLMEAEVGRRGVRLITLGCYGTHRVMQRVAEAWGAVRTGVSPGQYLDAAGQEVEGWRYQKRLARS